MPFRPNGHIGKAAWKDGMNKAGQATIPTGVESMSLESDLEEIIQKALTKRRQEEKICRAFDSQWGRIRRATILPLLTRATRIMTSKFEIEGKTHIDNDGITLEVVLPKIMGSTKHAMNFSPKGQKIIYSSSLGTNDPPEEHELRDLTEATIETKIKHFVSTITGSAVNITEQHSRGSV
jgi:hypothetical protein